MSLPPDEQPFSDSAIRDLSLTPNVSSRRRRRVLLGAGGILVVAGLLVPLVLGQHGGPGGLVATIGLFTAVVGLAYCFSRFETDSRHGSFPPVEARSAVERAGADVERAVAAAGSLRRGRAATGRGEAVERLRDLAVATVADRDGIDRADAEAAVRTGTWTDDPVAAELLSADSDDRGSDGSRWPFRDGRPSFEEQVERVVAALAGRPNWTPGWGRSRVPATTGEGWADGFVHTERWRGFVGLGLVALGITGITRTAGTALVAALVLGIAGYVRLFDPPAPTLSVERTFGASDPVPGEPVSVRVTVEHVGQRATTDLRLADDVPEGLAVIDGSPRHATALRPGESTTFAYEVRAVAGEHDFEHLYAVTRDPTGERTRGTRLETGTDTLACEPRPVAESVPLHPVTSGLTGRVQTDTGGSGTEFHSVRDYRPGDPLRRVDWNRVARTGEFATVQFREEQAATVVVLVDVREAAFRTPADGALTAVDRARSGAAQILETLLADGDRVGLATVGPGWTWVPPAGGRRHRTELRAILAGDPAFVTPDREGRFYEHRFLRLLRYRLPADSQLVCFSPLLDEEIVRILGRLHAHGYPVTVFSPDPTDGETVGGAVVRMERALTIERMRRDGLRVVDWSGTDPLPTAVARARRRWGR